MHACSKNSATEALGANDPPQCRWQRKPSALTPTTYEEEEPLRKNRGLPKEDSTTDMSFMEIAENE
jgi:hypothetical protein